ncbi:unnamed protein product, partial [Rotaria sp. Silwood1]
MDENFHPLQSNEKHQSNNMEQPLDLSITNTKNSFTIEYLTSNISKPKRKPIFYYQQSPLHPLENRKYSLNSTLNEHIVSNNCDSSTTNTSCALEIVNGGHGIKNPLFDCATEALQIQY